MDSNNKDKWKLLNKIELPEDGEYWFMDQKNNIAKGVVLGCFMGRIISFPRTSEIDMSGDVTYAKANLD